MNKTFSEFFRIPESVRIPILGGWLYRWSCLSSARKMEQLASLDLSLNSAPRKKKVIASMTSFPGRIDKIHLSIKSLFCQTHKPDRIILWLAEEQFPDHKLPSTIEELIDVGLEVKYVENIMGCKRWFYIYPELRDEELLVTFDDDIVFPEKCIERIIRTHEKFPDAIVCDRGQTVAYDATGKMLIPGRWKVISDEGVYAPSFKVLPSPGGGCLFFKGALHHDATDLEVVKQNLKTGDLFLMFMAVQNGTRIIRTEKYHRVFSVIPDTQQVQMGRDAIYLGHYEEALKRCAQTYPEAFSRLSER